jgi:hypothetical protein
VSVKYDVYVCVCDVPRCVSVQYVVYVCVFDVYPLQVFCQEVHSELLPLLDLGADKTVLFSGTNLLAKPPQISSDLRLVLQSGMRSLGPSVAVMQYTCSHWFHPQARGLCGIPKRDMVL